MEDLIVSRYTQAGWTYVRNGTELGGGVFIFERMLDQSIVAEVGAFYESLWDSGKALQRSNGSGDSGTPSASKSMTHSANA